VTKYLAAIIGFLVIVLLIGWHHVSAQNTTIKTQSDTIAQQQADADELDRNLKARDSVDRQFQEALSNADEARKRLVSQLGTGERRVYVRAACPKLPDTTSTSSTDAAAVELDPAARQDYADLRASITRTEQQVIGLQSYITNVCRKGQ
jgi:prophage endopeptidase